MRTWWYLEVLTADVFDLQSAPKMSQIAKHLPFISHQDITYQSSHLESLTYAVGACSFSLAQPRLHVDILRTHFHIPPAWGPSINQRGSLRGGFDPLPQWIISDRRALRLITERLAVQWLTGYPRVGSRMPVARSHLRNQVSRKLASSHNQVQVDCMINPQSIRFEPLSSSFPTLDPRRPPNNLQYVISNDSITFNVTEKCSSPDKLTTPTIFQSQRKKIRKGRGDHAITIPLHSATVVGTFEPDDRWRSTVGRERPVAGSHWLCSVSVAGYMSSSKSVGGRNVNSDPAENSNAVIDPPALT
ncbi:hypothetical protein T4D_13676 [Trichinella pseudospiralis]|uniref:Uncharacterized protein n=1 Tax=Trichinella pseudospiralis TaxID=6337 RepID=A0A0V1FNZ5_TRIPS|nr:hypothetical protein T4D_13676 [Trichinella pseudospiralis]